MIRDDPARGGDGDDEALLRATVPVRTMLRLHELKIRTGRTVQQMVNDAVQAYLTTLRQQARGGAGGAGASDPRRAGV